MRSTRWVVLIASVLSISACFSMGSLMGLGASTSAPGPVHAVLPPQTTQPTGLTAGAWDDNVNFDFYLSYLKRVDATALAGLPIVPRSDRMVISVQNSTGQPVPGATVTVSAGSVSLLTTTTGADGHALLFPQWAAGTVTPDPSAELQITASAPGCALGTATAHVGDATAQVAIADAPVATPLQLDFAIVIDTTGSMGDEISYLKSEIGNIATDIAQQNPNVDIHWGLVAYRDVVDTDTYVTKSVDFTSDLQAFETALGGLDAGGGGDYPEASELGLQAGAQLSWRAGNVARVMFHIGDAPQHDDKGTALISAVASARDLGVHIYPVAASGTDDLLEYTMRSEAEVTNGRYMFLTNDSGIGDDHLVPDVPCFVVTLFSKAMVRMVAMELSGKEIEPADSDVIRVSGDVENNQCVLSDGTTVTAI